MRNPICVALIACLVSCNDGQAPLSNDERDLVAQLGFDEPLIARVRRSGESIEQLIGVTPNFEAAPANGLLLLTKPGDGRAALAKIRTELSGSDYSAYLNDEAFGYDADKIAVVKSHDDYAYLAIVRTDGINYNLEHEAVLARYQQWQTAFDLSLIGAGQDWLEAQFGTPPQDWLTFAEQVYEFCPDVVDQGANDVETLAEEMRRSNALYLWWD